jgi:hypothetical protein
VYTVLGLFGILVFIVAVIAIAAGITWLVVRVTPKEKPRKTEDAAAES